MCGRQRRDEQEKPPGQPCRREVKDSSLHPGDGEGVGGEHPAGKVRLLQRGGRSRASTAAPGDACDLPLQPECHSFGRTALCSPS